MKEIKVDMHKNLKKVLEKSGCICFDGYKTCYHSECPIHGIEQIYETSPMVKIIIDALAKERDNA